MLLTTKYFLFPKGEKMKPKQLDPQEIELVHQETGLCYTTNVHQETELYNTTNVHQEIELCNTTNVHQETELCNTTNAFKEIRKGIQSTWIQKKR